MVKRAFRWFVGTALLGGTLFQLGCGGFGGLGLRTISAILNEDLFG
jgi:hypothetical protein